MFLRFSRTRLFLLLLLFLSLFALTACNRKDDGVSPPQTETKSTDALSQFMANIGNATFSIDLTPPEENPISPAQMLLQSDSSTLSMRKAVPKAAVAPNPNGSNLALSAVANASSYWPWPLYGFPFTPDHGNNGNLADCWAASFQYYSHWYRLDWTASQTIGRIYVSHAGTPVSTRGQTISSIRYYNQPTNSWLTIPGSTLTYGASKPMYVDFSFSPVQTTGIILYMNTGPENPHPNATVFISEIEVYGGATGSLKIASPTTGDVFAYGESINFIGSQTGTVTNIKWFDNGTEFASGLSTSKNDLTAGVHAITIRGLSAGSQVSDSVSITVVKSIKIKDVDTGQPPVLPFKMSSIRGIKRFQAIGCRDDAGNDEIGAVKVKWSLPDGNLDSAHTIRSQILDILGSNKGKIGVLALQNGTATEMLDSDTATFVSFFSGNITLKAEFRVDKTPHSVVPKTLSIGLKQPVVKLSFKIIRDVGFDLAAAELLANKANDLWSGGSENILLVQKQDFSWVENQTFEVLPVEQSSEYLLSPNLPTFLNPLVVDILTDAHYGLPYNPLDPRHVVPRQSEELLRFRTLFQKINVYLPKWAYAHDTLVEEIKAKSGVTISSRRYYQKGNSAQQINDANEGGIVLTYSDEIIQAGGDATTNQLLAHELGHMLGLNHVNNLSYLMHDFAVGTKISASEYVWALDYLNLKPLSSNFVMEE